MGDTQVWAWHIHHRTLYEHTDGPSSLRERRAYIKKDKPFREQSRRLRLLRLVTNQGLLTALVQAKEETFGLPVPLQNAIRRAMTTAIGKLHQYECLKCPWDGRTIFPKKKAK